ncbi:MAG: CHRD domain-containing protein [Bacteroidetes bacterium]|jgi:hypothetical protein|nr:CHRD domain-containing protein [Bacteroidota bacterium]
MVVAGDPPVANDDDATTPQNTPVDIAVLANDTDPEGGDLTITNASTPANGTATINDGGTPGDPTDDTITYEPDTDFRGTDTFTYTIEDPPGNTDQATVTVVVNDPPEANDDGATTDEDTSVDIDVLGNDTDDSGSVTITGTSSPANGTATIISGGTEVRYTPDANFNGTDTFTYTIDDGDGATDQATVTVTVTAVNDAPEVANPIGDQQLALTTGAESLDLSGTFSDVDGDALTLSATSGDTEVVTTSLDGTTLTLTPVATGSAQVTVTADDGQGPAGKTAATTQTSFQVSVVPGGNQAPIVVNPLDDQSVDGDTTPLTFDLGPVFDDPDGDPLSYQALSTNRSAALTAISGATLTVTPTGNGDANIIVTALDPDGASAQDVFAFTASGITVQTETFEATLSGAHEVPANASRATGTITATLQEGTLTVTGSFEGLESPFNPDIGGGAHIHLGYFGQNGPVDIALTASTSGDGLSGTFEAADNTYELDEGQIETLRARQYYVNIHTEALPAGEIRGQLIPALDGAGKQDGDDVYRSILSGRAETTANASPGVGGVLVERRGDQLIASGAFSGLESDFATDIGAHIHEAGLGIDGGVIFALTVAVGDDDRSGTFAAGANTFTLDATQRAALEAGDYYVNVHSETYPAGEIRGQVLPFSMRVFEATLAGMNEVPPVMTAGTGGALLAYDTETSELTVSGAFGGLESNFATDIGAHIHEAGPATNGGVIFPLAVTVGDDDRSGSFPAADNVFTLDAAQADALYGGQYYVNVHSDDDPGGEVRGQALASTNVAPSAPEITSPADGAAVNISGDPATAFSAEWSDASDANGNDVVYRWQLALDANFETVLVDSVLTGTSFTTDFGTVGTLLTANGVPVGGEATLYHRAVASDGSFQTAGPGASVTLTRGELTADEAAPDVPATFTLRGNYPNPFNPSTTVVFDLSEAATVTVEVSDLLGRTVMSLPAQSVAPGTGHRITLDAADLASGTYLVRVMAETDAQTLVETQSVTLVK